MRFFKCDRGILLVIGALILGWGGFGILWLAAYILGSNHVAFASFWLKSQVSMLIAVSLICMCFVYRRSIEIADELLYTLNSPEDSQALVSCYKFTFSSKWQILHSCGWAVVFPAVAFSMGMHLDWVVSSLMCLGFVASGFLMSAGLWFTFAMIRLIYKYASLQPRVNWLCPNRTVALLNLTNLVSSWACCFLLGAILIISGFIQAPWSGDTWISKFFEVFWVGFVVVFVAVNFFVPHLALRPVIVHGKQVGLRFLGSRIEDLVEGRLEGQVPESQFSLESREREIIILREYRDAYAALVRSGTWAVDTRAFGRFFSALLIPWVVFCLQNPEMCETVWNWMGSQLGLGAGE